ncbi:MAG: MaoC family dehydratase N-terminal domain-containing protein [Rhizobiaceae bacterium]|nr:MaoC family dehydratase N-terminal domain-containing protein [Rhizobiaceae bacterium]
MTRLEDWIGKTQSRTEIINHRQAELLAVTLDKPVPENGAPLPACWHWAWFNDALPGSELGRDGHPKRGGFLPPVPLPRRMWAGGEIDFINPLSVGNEIKKVSTIEKVKHRDGQSGKLCIVTIGHQFLDGDHLCIDEKQNLVFRGDPEPDAPAPAPVTPPKGAQIEDELHPDPVMMFRYSALTFNGHRIHYDVDYARDIEGYPDLVFHAPLTATALCDLAAKLMGDKPVRHFEYRATSPLFCNAPVQLKGKEEDNVAVAWAETPAGSQAMIATAKS